VNVENNFIHLFQTMFYIVMTSILKSDEFRQISGILSIYIIIVVVVVVVIVFVTVLNEIWTSQVQYMSDEGRFSIVQKMYRRSKVLMTN